MSLINLNYIKMSFFAKRSYHNLIQKKSGKRCLNVLHKDKKIRRVLFMYFLIGFRIDPSFTP